MSNAGNNRLPVLAGEIHRAHEAARASVRQSLQHAIEAGERLLEAKAHVAHGQWLPWLKEHCRISERTAQAYMRLARNREAVTKSATAADLTIRAAVEVLAEPKAANLIPYDGAANIGMAVNSAGCEIIVIRPDGLSPGFYHVTHIVLPRGPDKAVMGHLHRPIRSDFIRTAIEMLRDTCGIPLPTLPLSGVRWDAVQVEEVGPFIDLNFTGPLHALEARP